jgi:alpha-beta hydrolase superfamily lysophospholipase
MWTKDFLSLNDGTQIFIRYHQKPELKTWLLHCHGIGEYSGRHDYIKELFGDTFNILQWDLRGHGHSSGKRGYVQDFRDYMLDVSAVIDFMIKQLKSEEYVLTGHSMGALVVSTYLQNFSRERLYPKGFHINAPPVNIGGRLEKLTHYMKPGLVKALHALPFSFPVPNTIEADALSHDPEVVRQYYLDPLNCTKLQSQLLISLFRETRRVFNRPLSPQCPSFITQGTSDTVVCPKACKSYFAQIEHDFNYWELTDSYHEIHNEIDQFRLPYFEHLQKIITPMAG